MVVSSDSIKGFTKLKVTPKELLSVGGAREGGSGEQDCSPDPEDRVLESHCLDLSPRSSKSQANYSV